MGRDFIPGSDTEFQAWALNFVNYANAHLVELGIEPADIAPIASGYSDFITSMSANVTAQQAAQAARQTKDAARDTLEAVIRQLVRRCEIWVKVAAPADPPPTGAEDLSFVTLDMASPYIAEYDGSDGGKTAHYMLRWVKTNGEKGPWSETLSATITA